MLLVTAVTPEYYVSKQSQEEKCDPYEDWECTDNEPGDGA